MNDPDRALEALLRNDFHAFALKVLHTLEPGHVLYNWHQDAMAHVLNEVRKGKERRLIINVPPRMGKSIYVLALCAFVHGHDPTAKIASISYAAPLSAKLARDYRTILDADWYKGLFPGTRISKHKNSEDEIGLTAGGYRLAWTLGGSITGRGANLIIVDDPIKADEALSETIRNTTNERFDNTVLSRFDDKMRAAIIVVMQRFHLDDLSGHLLKKGGWTHFSLPAIAEEEELIRVGRGKVHHRRVGDVLHPAREGLALLKQQRADMGELCFSAQYQQRPIPLEGNLVKWAWFKTYEAAPTDGFVVQSWDTASKAGPANSYSVCMTFRRDRGKNYLLHVRREQVDYPALKDIVIQHARSYNCGVVLIEDTALGTALLQDLRCGDHYSGYISIRPDSDKITRMEQASAEIRAGNVLLPAEAPWLAEFQLEVLQFPHAARNDQVDALSQYLNYARQLHVPSITPPELLPSQCFIPDDNPGGYGGYGYYTQPY